MTGLEKIVKQIQDEARQSADAVVTQAEAEAREITEKAKAESAKKSAEIEAKSKSDVENFLASAKSAAALSVRRAVLAEKQKIISELIAEAQESIYTLPDNEYFALILKMAGRFALPEDGEILFSAKDFNRLPDNFADSLNKVANGGKLSISKETRNIDGGFVLTYGGVEENCSIEALFYAARESLQDKVQELLFS